MGEVGGGLVWVGREDGAVAHVVGRGEGAVEGGGVGGCGGGGTFLFFGFEV